MSFNVIMDAVVQARFYCIVAPQVSINSIGYICTNSTGAGITDVELVAQLSPLYGAKMRLLMPPEATYSGCGVQRVDPPQQSISTYGNIGTGVGSLGDTMGVKQVAGLIRKNTNLAGRGGHGRWYMPFIPSAQSVGTGQPSAGYLAALASLSVVMQNGFTITGLGGTATISPCLIRFARAAKVGPPPKPAVAFRYTPITTCKEQPYFATQRRRGDYGRPNVLPF